MGKNKIANSPWKSSNSLEIESLVIYSVYFGVISVYLGTLLMISNKINEIQPIPYLDEIYHVPQAQEYCSGNFSHVTHNQVVFRVINGISFSILNSVGPQNHNSSWTVFAISSNNHTTIKSS